MAVEIEIFEVDNNKIRVKHSFFGVTESDARKVMNAYAAANPNLRARIEADDDSAIESVDDDTHFPEPSDFDDDEED